MTEEIKEKGGISVQTDHIFPIIKRWLYSEKEIFLREIVSNASDAVTKLKRLCSLGQADVADDYKITVKIDEEEGTLTVSDNGIGMNADEVKKYICQIALSGALEFIEKYEGESEGAGAGIIGHFGLGFYSSFMVSSRVELVTKSYDGSPAVRWTCTGGGEYELDAAERAERGTDVIMYITEDEKEFLQAAKIREVLTKYCSFLPVPVFLETGEADKEPEAINDTHPLWQKNPSECTDEEYDAFYNKVFADYKTPLFHIHINADYPLNFKGILYFPKINSAYEPVEGQIKLYYNQIFVADNIKEMIPDYLLLLKGVLDCPELPLNVSRSYLQNNTYVSKLSAHIVKKVADKLNSLFNTDRTRFEEIWDDIKIFFEYASLKDRKFYDRVKDSYIMKTTDGSFLSLCEYLEAAKETNENTVYYCEDKTTQAQYLSLFAAQQISVVEQSGPLDTQFIAHIEQDKKIKFSRVDADLSESLAEDKADTENEKLISLFKEICDNEKLTITCAALKDENVPALLTISEESRRMNDMMKAYGMAAGGAGEEKLTLNTKSPLMQKLEKAEGEEAKSAARQIYSLALLSQRGLTAKELTDFLAQSYHSIEKGL
ncbi:MAG: molecular chaperone HtpG [Clostridiales bacterium]|nr:molecular chaperone HtpG [Clostridiales bacterium]